MRKKLFLLTAAGFSVEFMEYGKHKLNTDFLTKLLVEELLFKKFVHKLCDRDRHDPNDIEKLCNIQKLCSTIYSDIKKIKGDETNFEHIIYALEKICDISETKSKEEIIIPSIEKMIQEVVVREGKYKILWVELYALKSFILDVVALFENDKFENQRSDLICQFKKTLNHRYNISHYTLNYDDLFVQESFYNDGIESPLVIRETKLDNIKSYFIHGSVFFSRAGSEIRVEDKATASSYRKELMSNQKKSYFIATKSNTDIGYFDPLIIGLEKSIKLQNYGYDFMWHQCVRDFYDAKELIIIGYSFNDAHINSLLRYTFTESNISRVIVVDKKEKEGEINNFVATVQSKLTPLEGNIEQLETQKSERPSGHYTGKFKINEKEYAIEFYLNGAKDFLHSFVRENESTN